ncbi:MAG: isopentenyl phosphate kinase [Candidatus Poseidoniaceae archaeon]|jgi:isopentenyl phosphate kinase|nr:isopentenyl phosphate kinase [Candidatus Poseidoniaceae archaeon]
MAGTVVIKLGGGLITHKDKLCTINREILDGITSVLSRTDKKLIIIHGAGSFGHIKSKKYMLQKGRVQGLDQDKAIAEVRTDMLELNRLVMDSLSSHGIIAESYPPHNWAEGTGPDFRGNLPISTGVTVTFGDVVKDNEKEFGILSGDDLVLRYALETDDVERVIFAIGGVDGLMKVPPSEATPDDLIEELTDEIEYRSEHYSEIDVTGGIGLKIERGARIAEKGVEVLLVNGYHSERVLSAIEGKMVRGTKILPRNC